MNRQELLAKILNKRVQDFSYLIVFFLIFAVFVFFAIRPNLVTAFSLQKQLDELRDQDERYETIILNIVSYQALIEQTRDDFYLFDQALPKSPMIFDMVNDIRNAATESGMTVDNMEISEVALKEATPAAGTTNVVPDPGDDDKKRNFIVKFQVTSSFNAIRNFITAMFDQRRLKMVNTMNVTADSTVVGSQSATFNFSFIVEGYYL